MSDYFEIGKIVNTQGLKGDVRIIPFTFDPNRFKLLKEITVRLNNETRTMVIDTVRFHKQFVIVKFEGIDNCDDAARLKNGVLIIQREEALPLSEDEYYITDLYGMEVVTEGGEALGIIHEIIETGANDVYAVKDKHTGKDILIPAIKQCILRVDVINKKMTVRLLEGLR